MGENFLLLEELFCLFFFERGRGEGGEGSCSNSHDLPLFKIQTSHTTVSGYQMKCLCRAEATI